MHHGSSIIVVDQNAFRTAIEHTRRERYFVNVVLAQELVERVYAIRKGETGDAFRALFDRVIEYCAIPEDQRRGYELMLGRYFNIRAVAALKRHPEKRCGPWIPQVLKVDRSRVEFQVFPELAVTFGVVEEPERGMKLNMSNIRIIARASAEGVSRSIPGNTYYPLAKRAVAILNDARARTNSAQK